MTNYMLVALKEAKKAYKNGDIPVGAVIVKDNKIISRAYNKKNLTNDPTMHAEILAIKKACKKVKDFRLCDAVMYVTKEPCIMCYGACLSARIKTIYYGCGDKKYSVSSLHNAVKFNHDTEMVGGIMEQECSLLLTNFFADLRRDKCN